MTYILFKMADDHMEVIPPSDNESESGLLEIVNEHNESESGLLETVNEHNEVLGVVLSNNQPPCEPPLREENMFSSSESESETPNYFVEASDSEQEEENIPHIRVPLKNYSRDTEDPDDFVNNWLWVFEDTGPSYGPFTGIPGMNILPNKIDPISYFELFFDPAMYIRIAGQTNEYANQRIQKLSGDLPFIT